MTTTFTYSGSVSTGTLRQEDLLPAFSDTLDALLMDERLPIPPDVAERNTNLVTEARSLLALDGWTDEQNDSVNWLVNESLPDALGEYAPEGYYFGTLEGDGADFGFWPVDD